MVGSRGIGPRFVVNTVTTVFQGLVQMAGLADGALAMARATSNTSTPDRDRTDLCAQGFNVHGRKLGLARIVNAGLAGPQGSPAATALVKGDFVANSVHSCRTNPAAGREGKKHRD